MSKHTPGPWQVGCPHGLIMTEIATASYSRGVATVWTKQSVKGERDTFERWLEGEANAHLIAAAPDLLEACKAVLEMIQKREEEKGYADRYDVSAAAWLKMVIKKAEEGSE